VNCLRHQKELAGLGASAALMLAGLLLLPEPGFSAVPNLFALLWLLTTAGAMLGYGVSAWRSARLQGIRRRWRRRRAPSPAAAKGRREAISAALIRERERRLD